MDLLCRTSAEFLRELAETDIGGGGSRVLAAFVRGVYRASTGRLVPLIPRKSPRPDRGLNDLVGGNGRAGGLGKRPSLG